MKNLEKLIRELNNIKGVLLKSRKYEDDSQYVKHSDGEWHKVLDVKDDGKPHGEGGGNWYHLEDVKSPVHQNDRGPLASGKMLNAGIKKSDEDEIKIEEKKRQYANINNKMPDPMKENTNIAIKEAKRKKMNKEEGGPDMASPDKPKGLDDKRKPVTHDECGRPFAKKDGSEPDEETKNFLEHFDPPTKHPKEPTAGMPASNKPGQKTTSTGFKLKLVKALSDAGYRESALLLKNWGEMDSIATEMAKSNYGPKKIGDEKVSLYSDTDNIKRKQGRTGVEVEGAGGNRAQKEWASGGRDSTKSQIDREAKELKAKNKKQPVKTMADFSPEQIKAMEEAANKIR